MSTQGYCYNGDPLSLGSISSGRLKNNRDADKWLSPRLCRAVRGMLITGWLGFYLCSPGCMDKMPVHNMLVDKIPVIFALAGKVLASFGAGLKKC